MASVQGEFVGIVVTGLRRREAMVAPRKGSSWREADVERVRVRGLSAWKSEVGGRRSLAASQSSSTNYIIIVSTGLKHIEALGCVNVPC